MGQGRVINLRGVLAEDVGVWWPAVEGWVEQALSHGPGLYAPEDVLERVLAREMQLWVACDDEEPIGCVTTSVEKFPRRTVLLIGVVAGRRGRSREWIKGMDDLLRAYARHAGCDLQLAEGRLGWDRFVGNGWRMASTFYKRELDQ